MRTRYVTMGGLARAERTKQYEVDEGYGARKVLTGAQLSNRLALIGAVPGGPDVIFLPAAAVARARVNRFAYPLTGHADERLGIVGKARGVSVEWKR